MDRCFDPLDAHAERSIEPASDSPCGFTCWWRGSFCQVCVGQSCRDHLRANFFWLPRFSCGCAADECELPNPKQEGLSYACLFRRDAGPALVCVFVSIQVSTVAIGLLAFSSFPLFVTFLEPVVFNERLRRHDVITSLAVVAGLILVTPNWDLSYHLTQGLLWGIFGAFTLAVLSLMSRSYVQRYPTLTVSFYQQAFACVCDLPFALQWEGELLIRDISLLVVLGVVFTGFAQGLAVASLRHLRVQTVGVAY